MSIDEKRNANPQWVKLATFDGDSAEGSSKLTSATIRPRCDTGVDVVTPSVGFVSRTRRMIVVLAVLAGCAVFVNPYLRGDGNGYYAYVRSVVIDHDLKFQNEFARGDPAFTRQQAQYANEEPPRPGYIRNQWSPGASILWTPFFLVAHGFVKIVGHWPADGYSYPYRWACAFGTALYAAIGLYLAREVARRVTNAKAATLAAVAIIGASSLPIYMFFLPFWGLALATLPEAGLLYLFARGPTWKPKRWAAYGALVGFATLIHPLGIAWLALLAFAWLADKGTVKERVTAGVASAGGFIAAQLPGLIIRQVVHADPFDTGYQVIWNFTSPPILPELFSAKHGLFSWTPIALLAVLGLVMLWRKGQQRIAVGLLAVFGFLLYLSAAYVTEEQSSFGNRLFVHFTPGFVVGAAMFLSWLRARRKEVATIGVGVLVTWNALFAFQWAWGLLPKRGAVNWAQMARQQFTTAPKEIGRVAVRFFTDRQGLIDEVQARDEERLSRGEN